MTDAALYNALMLGTAVLILWIMLGRILAGRRGHGGGPAPFMAEGSAPAREAEGDAAAVLARRYALKKRFRLGVLVFSLLALAAYGPGESRAGALFLLLCAGVCQYGVYRQRTAALLAETMRRGAFAAPEEIRGGGRAGAAQDTSL